MKRVLLSLLIGFSILGVRGQCLDVTHFMRISPFRNYDMPSASTVYNGYISLPGGYIHAGVNLGAIRYNNLFETNAEGYPTTLTATRFVNSLAKNNYFGVHTNVELFGFGFRFADKFFLTFDARLVADMDLRYSKDVLGLPVYGNMAYVDEPANLDLRPNLNAYQEFGISFRHEVNDQISWGIRPKLLLGIANLHTKSLSAQLMTDPTDYSLTMTYNASLMAASVVPFYMTFNGEDGFQLGLDSTANGGVIAGNAFKNLGMGLDLGFSYKPIESVNISVGLLDLGFIRWKTSTHHLSSAINDAGGLYNDGSVTFSGLTQSDIQGFIDGGNVSSMLDTLAQYFPLDIESSKPYTTALPVRFMVQGDYEFAKHHCISAAAQFRFASNYFQPSFTIAYDGLFFNIIDVCVAYTMQRRSFDNLGVGLGINLGYLNLFAGTQNIIAAFSMKNASQLTATAGVVFNWGHIKNWRKLYSRKELKSLGA